MLRSFIPFLLVSLGFTMILWADKMPLFEWQVSEIATDLSSACNVTLPPTYWTTGLGEPLDAGGEKFNIFVKRSWANEALDHVSLILHNNIPWLFIVVVLSMIYMWWFLLWYKNGTVLDAIGFTAIAIFMCLTLSQVVRLAGPSIGWMPYYSRAADCHGTITFSAQLAKTYYETAAILFVGIIMELGALGMMARQIVKAVTERKESSRGTSAG